VLTAVLVLAQMLGLLHRVGHGSDHADHALHAHQALQSAGVPQGNGGHAHAHAAHGDEPTGDWLQQLLSGHAAGSDCLGFDHAVAGDGLVASALCLPMAIAMDDTVPDARRVWHLAAQAAGYLARGPPHLS
jgi:hypothetical protein